MALLGLRCSSCDVRASHRGNVSCFGARALGREGFSSRSTWTQYGSSQAPEQGSIVTAPGLCCSEACRIFPDLTGVYCCLPGKPETFLHNGITWGALKKNSNAQSAFMPIKSESLRMGFIICKPALPRDSNMQLSLKTTVGNCYSHHGSPDQQHWHHRELVRDVAFRPQPKPRIRMWFLTRSPGYLQAC